MTRKFLFLLLSYVAVTSRGEAAQISGLHRSTPTHPGHAPSHARALAPRRLATEGQAHADPLVAGKVSRPYEYRYAVRRDQATPPFGHDTPLFGHTEAHNGHKREGKYFVHLPDGRVQTVTYYADETGYHPTVSYEGTAHYDAHAAAPHHAPAKAYHAPEPAYHAPEPAYHAPEPAYHAPEPAYHAPEPAYHAPEPTYHAPEPAYHAPEPTYHASEPIYHAPGPRYKAPAYNTLKPVYQNPGLKHRAFIPTHAPGQAYEDPKPTYNAPRLHHKTPRPVHHAPEPTYKTPEPAYHAPEPTFEALERVYHDLEPAYTTPKPVYRAPEPSYTTPKPVYHAPEPSYTTPKPVYRAPEPSYTTPKPVYQAPGSISHAQPSYTTPKPTYYAPEPLYRTPAASQGTHADAPHPLALPSDLQVTSQPRHPTSLNLPILPTAAPPTRPPPNHRISSPTSFPEQTLAVPLSGLRGRHSAAPLVHDLLSTSGIDFDADDLSGPGPRPLAMRSNGHFDATTAAFDLSQTLFRNAVDSWPELRP